MAKLTDILIGSGLALGAGYLIYKIVNTTAEASAFVNQLQFNIKPSSIKLDGKILSPASVKLIIKVDVEFINPTKTSVSFQKPNVTLKYKNAVFAQSKISTDMVTINPFGTSRIKDITFEIPLFSSGTLTTIIDMLKTAGTGISVNANDTLANKLMTVFSLMSNNVLTKLLPLLEVSLITYIGSTPITYSTKLA